MVRANNPPRFESETLRHIGVKMYIGDEDWAYVDEDEYSYAKDVLTHGHDESVECTRECYEAGMENVN